MDADRLKLLLRQRATALAPNPAVLDRALARCARLGVRQSAISGRQSSSTLATSPPTVLSQPPRADAPQAITVPSLATGPAEAAPAGQLASGRIVAGYRIEGLLGKGGMGSVYRATQLSMNRPVAFKVLAARLADDPTFVGRFRREARAAGRLHHPNLVTVHDSGEADGLVFFSMELVEGRSLKAVLKERGSLPADEALRLARQALEALAYAHGRGVIHRDIKPDNLMLTANGQIKVADLGLSRIEDGEASATNVFETSAGSFMGTPHYMAPEQGRDAHAADQRSDLYSLGATVYHLICGQPPFGGTTPMEVLLAAQSQPLRWPEPQPPGPVRAFLGKLLEKDPARRPADASAALAALDRVLTPHAGTHRPVRRRSWLRILLTIAALGVAAYLFMYAVERVRENGRERAWVETLNATTRVADDKRFSEALDTLRRAREQFADGSPRAVECDEAMAEISAAWDAWAVAKLAGVELAVREHLAAGRYPEALNALRKVPDAWRSPEAERRLDALQRAWEDAAARDAGRKPEAKRLLDDVRARRTDAWRKIQAVPANSFLLREGQAVFTGTGRADLPLPGPAHLAPVTLRLAWRGETPPEAMWRIELAPGLDFTLRAGAAELGGRPVLRNEDGSVTLALTRRGGGLTVLTRGRDGPLVQQVPGASGEPGLRWALGAGEVEASLDGKR